MQILVQCACENEFLFLSSVVRLCLLLSLSLIFNVFIGSAYANFMVSRDTHTHTHKYIKRGVL
jgi:hypothetical protein